MALSIEAILWYVVLIDSLGANIMTWFFPKWYKKTYKRTYKIFPASKGWSALYLVLVLWLGYALNRLSVI